MFPDALVGSPNIEIESVNISQTEAAIQLRLRSRAEVCRCPSCGASSRKVHSEYERQLKDLPCSGRAVSIILEVRRYFCKNTDCSRKTFSERLPDLTQPYARQTNRLRRIVEVFGLLVGGSMSKQLLARVHIPVSLWSILRHLRKIIISQRPTPRILGVDDWAIRRGHHYGTVLVNLETSEVIDVLVGRDAQTLANWLQAHPGVEVISRDRAENYAEGGRQGAPEAVQVADRWHLLKNLGEMLVRVLSHHHHELNHAASTSVEETAVSPLVSTGDTGSPRNLRFLKVHELKGKGFHVSAIARQTGLDRKTVRKYLDLTTLSDVPRIRSNKLEPYKAYLLEHWQNGQRTVKQLWLDIRALGFTGCHSVVAEYLAQVRKENGIAPYIRFNQQVPIAAPRVSPRYAAWVLLARPDQLDEQDLALRSRLPECHPDIQLAATIAQRFAQLVRGTSAETLETWLLDSLASTLSAIRAFARSLQHDFDAVKAALTLPWTNGPVEGHVNRIKFLKRQMFGRAKFDLLRLRILA